jgi:hypothetical protein
MKRPRFRLRSLVILIVLVALLLTIGVVTRENARLRVELSAALQQSRAFTATALFQAIGEGNTTVLTAVRPNQSQSSATSDADKASLPTAVRDLMPNGPDAFAGTSRDN